MSIELWTWATPNGWKVSIMLEELIEAGVELPPIEVHHVNIMDREQFSDEFTAIVPNQKIPGLVHGETKLMESCAILLYLGESIRHRSRWRASCPSVSFPSVSLATLQPQRLVSWTPLLPLGP